MSIKERIIRIGIFATIIFGVAGMMVSDEIAFWVAIFVLCSLAAAVVWSLLFGKD